MQLSLPTAAGADDELRDLLAGLGGELPLRVTLDARPAAVGHPCRVAADTLWLAPEGVYGKFGHYVPTERLVAVPLGDIVRVEQWQPGSGGGSGATIAFGMIIGAGLGAAVGVGVGNMDLGGWDSPDESDDSHGSAAVIGALIGAIVGGAASGLFSPAGDDWVEIHPGGAEAPAPPVPHDNPLR